MRRYGMENLYLIGFMGTGKSTVAKFFQDEYHMKLFEMDEEIVQQEQRSIADIFAGEGEAYFRNLETALVKKFHSETSLVVSCGGGTVLRPENVAMMKKSGKVVLLRAKPETILERVKQSTDRPLLNGNMNVEYIAELMEKRKAIYESSADLIIDTDGKSVREICGEIIGGK